MGVYEQSWFPLRFFNLLATFNVWATREAPRILEWIAIPFFQRIFRTQGSNLGLLHYRQTLFSLSHQGSPYYPYFVEKLNLRIILLRFFKKIFYPSTQREYWSQSQIGGEILWTVDGWKFTAHFNFLTASSETGIVLGISQCCLRSPYLTVRQQFPFSTDELWNWESLLFQRQAVNYGAEWRFYFRSDIEVDALLTPKRAQVHW